METHSDNGATAIGVTGSLGSGLFAIVNQAPWWTPLACAGISALIPMVNVLGRVLLALIADRRAARIASAIAEQRLRAADAEGLLAKLNGPPLHEIPEPDLR